MRCKFMSPESLDQEKIPEPGILKDNLRAYLKRPSWKENTLFFQIGFKALLWVSTVYNLSR